MSKVRGSRMNHVYRMVYLRGRYVNRESEIDADTRVSALSLPSLYRDRKKKEKKRNSIASSPRPITFYVMSH